VASTGCDYLLEDGSGAILLESGDHLLQEACVPVVASTGGRLASPRRIRVQTPPRPEPVTLIIEAIVLTPEVVITAEVNDDEVVLELLAGILR
jgi:hypothetical protein